MQVSVSTAIKLVAILLLSGLCQGFLQTPIAPLRATGAEKAKASATDLLAVGSKWSGKNKAGVVTTYEVTSRDKTEVVLERPSIDNNGNIVVTLKVKGDRLSVKSVTYRGNQKRADRTLGGKARMNGETLNLEFKVETTIQGGTPSQWSETHKLSLEE